jgi:hypothetical protein
MKTLLLFAVVSGLTGGCSGGSTPGSSASPAVVVTPAGATTPGAVVYTCSMHPEVVSDQPGKCPQCKMDLVVKK